MTQAPSGGRAEARGRAIAELASSGRGSADWDRVLDDGGHRVLDLSDPFESAPTWEPRPRRDATRSRRFPLPDLPRRSDSGRIRPLRMHGARRGDPALSAGDRVAGG
jgi:hypothetical protein